MSQNSHLLELELVNEVNSNSSVSWHDAATPLLFSHRTQQFLELRVMVVFDIRALECRLELWKGQILHLQGVFRFDESLPKEDCDAYPEIFMLPKGVHEVSLYKPWRYF
jgi:hypothetical protein